MLRPPLNPLLGKEVTFFTPSPFEEGRGGVKYLIWFYKCLFLKITELI